MQLPVRIIPRLDIKGPNLVKGIHLEGLRVLGKPEKFAKYYYEQGADELLYVDVVASLYQRNSLDDIIAQTAKNIFIPLTVAGGLRSIEDIKRVLRAGADKVAINTAAIHNPKLITQAANIFGSSTICISIEAIKQADGKYLAFTDNGREHTGLDVIEWAKQITQLGAGEILLTSVDQEGTGKGYDIELTKNISDMVSIPIIACGGAGKLKHIVEVVNKAGADAISLASMLHYDFIQKHQTDFASKKEGNIEFLNSGCHYSIVDSVSINEIKKELVNNKIPCRITQT